MTRTGQDYIDKLERKFGRFAIQNISLLLIICYAFGYVISFINPQFLQWLMLNPYYILRGQIWRLVTWIVIPPSGDNLFFILLMLYFYYSIGTSIERTWGTFRYNVYLFSGMLFTVLGSFLLYGFCVLSGAVAQPYGHDMLFWINEQGLVYFGMFSTYYVNMSIFLAYAATFPEMRVLLMFIIPIKVKYLGIFYGIMLVAGCLTGGIVTWCVVGASLLNFVIFFLSTRNLAHMSPRQIKRRQTFHKEVRRATNGVTKHKCAVCGRTELDGENLTFRFCTRCEGNYEYCEDHLFTHEHVKRS